MASDRFDGTGGFGEAPPVGYNNFAMNHLMQGSDDAAAPPAAAPGQQTDSDVEEVVIRKSGDGYQVRVTRASDPNSKDAPQDTITKAKSLSDIPSISELFGAAPESEEGAGEDEGSDDSRGPASEGTTDTGDGGDDSDSGGSDES